MGGRQFISLAPSCFGSKVIIHEIIHAWGFYHEQNSANREKYVSINWSNIKQEKRYNYELQKDSKDFNVPYDGKSIMHYSAFNSPFAINPKLPTMTSEVSKVMVFYIDKGKVNRQKQ